MLLCSFADCPEKSIDKSEMAVLEDGKHFHQKCWAQHKARSTLSPNDSLFLRSIRIAWDQPRHIPLPVLRVEE
jgi:hypothetical protein